MPENRMSRRSRRLIGLAVGATFFVLGVSLLQGIFLGPAVNGLLRSALHVSAGSVKGTILGDILIQDARTLAPPGGGSRVFIEIDSARIRYSLWNILRGMGRFLAATKIEVRGIRVTLDLDSRDREADAGHASTPGPSFRPRRIPHIEVTDALFSLRGRGTKMLLKDAELRISPPSRGRAGTASIVIDVPDLSLASPYAPCLQTVFSARARLGADEIAIDRMQVGTSLVLTRGRVDLRDMDREGIRFDGEGLALGGHLQFAGSLMESRLSADMSASAVNLDLLTGFLRERVFGGLLDMTAKVRLDTDTPADMAGEAKLRVRRGVVRGVPIDHLAMAAEAGEGQILVRRLEAAIGKGRFGIEDLHVPIRAALEGDQAYLLRAISGRFSLDLEDIPAALDMIGIGPPADHGDIPHHRLVLAGAVRDGGRLAVEGHLSAAGGSVLLQEGRLVLPASGQSSGAASLGGMLEFRMPNLLPLSRLLRMPAVGGSLEAELNVAGTVAAPEGSVRIRGYGVTVRDVRFGTVAFTGRADPGRIVVDRAEIRQGSDRVTASGSYQTDTGSMNGAALEVSITDIGVYAGPFVPMGWRLSGQMEARASAHGPWDRPEGRVDLKFTKGRLADVEIRQVALQAESSDGEVRISRLDLETAIGSAEAAGLLTTSPGLRDIKMRIDQLVLRHKDVAMRSVQQVRASISTGGDLSVEDLALDGDAGSLRIRAAVTPSRGLVGRLTASRLKGDGWIESFLGDAVSFRGGDLIIDLAGTTDAPVLHVRGDVKEICGREAPVPLSASFEMVLSPHGLAVENLDCTAEDGLTLHAEGNLPVNPLMDDRLAPGEISMTLLLESPDLRVLTSLLPGDLAASGALRAEMRLSGTWENPEGEFTIEGSGLSLPARIPLRPTHPLSLLCRCDLRPGRLVVRSFGFDSPELRFTAAGEWSGVPSKESPVPWREQVFAGGLAFHGELEMKDIGWTAGAVSWIRRLGGNLRVQGGLSGTLRDPRPIGTISLRDGEIRADVAVPSVRKMSLDAAFDPERTVIHDLRGELGGAPFRLTGTLNHKKNGPFTLDLALQGENLLIFRNEGIKVRGDADLSLRGPLAGMKLEGEARITDGRYVKNIDPVKMMRSRGGSGKKTGLQLFSLRDPPWKDMVFDVNLSAEEPFYIRNNFFKGEARPQLHLGGTGEIPVLTGVTYVDSLLLKMPAGRIRFVGGVVRFPPGEPDRPKIDIPGTARMMGYDITVTVQGAYDEPAITLSSVPPLPEEELLLLVLTGRPPQSGFDRAANQRTGMAVAVFLGKDFLSRVFGSESTETDETILERFDMEVGRGVSRKGEYTVESRFRVADGIIEEKDTVYIIGERDEFDAYNLGVRFVFRFR